MLRFWALSLFGLFAQLSQLSVFTFPEAVSVKSRPSVFLLIPAE